MAKKKTTSARGARKRRGKSESMTGAKENAVEVRTIGIGDNSGLSLIEPNDWNHHKKTIKGWREKVSTAQASLRNAIKAAKKAGVNMESMNMVVGIERQNDPAKAMDFFRQVDLGLSLSEETTLRITPHDTLIGEVTEGAYDRGVADGEAGKTAASRYPEGSDLDREYTRGWHHGTGKNLGLTPEQVDEQLAEQEAA